MILATSSTDSTCSIIRDINFRCATITMHPCMFSNRTDARSFLKALICNFSVSVFSRSARDKPAFSISRIWFVI